MSVNVNDKDAPADAPEQNQKPTLFKLTSLLDKEGLVYLGGVFDPGVSKINHQIEGIGYHRMVAAPFTGKYKSLKPYSKIQKITGNKIKYYVISSIPFLNVNSPEKDYILSHIFLCVIARKMNDTGIVKISSCELEPSEKGKGYGLAIPAECFDAKMTIDLDHDVEYYRKIANEISIKKFTYRGLCNALCGNDTVSLKTMISLVERHIQVV